MIDYKDERNAASESEKSTQCFQEHVLSFRFGYSLKP